MRALKYAVLLNTYYLLNENNKNTFIKKIGLPVKYKKMSKFHPKMLKNVLMPIDREKLLINFYERKQILLQQNYCKIKWIRIV